MQVFVRDLSKKVNKMAILLIIFTQTYLPDAPKEV